MKVLFAVLSVLMVAMAAWGQDVSALSGGHTLSGPFTHENFTLFLIHGPDRLAGVHYLTLQEAMDQKAVVVHETGNVNELAVENVGSSGVFIQSGDIVKGGRQDRTISLDFICPPKSGRMPIESFCVEHGRWQQRGAEAPGEFQSHGFIATN